MSLFGRVFGKPPGGGEEDGEDDSEVERCLQQISDARHAGDRRDAMAQLSTLVQDNARAQAAIGAMGLPVLLSVLQEDRDDIELLKGALEVLHLSVAQPEIAGAAQQQQQQQPGGPQQQAVPPPALINADLFCHAPDNVLLLLGLLRPEPEGCEDFYVRYAALQALGGLLAACPDKLQACVLSSPLGVVALTELLGQPMEVLRNEALLLLVGLCAGCPQLASIAAFEGAFERLLAICGAEGGLGAGDVVVQDAAELLNNLLRDNLANQRLFREMGHINQLPPLLVPPPAAPPQQPSAAAGLFGAASQYVDPSLRAAAGGGRWRRRRAVAAAGVGQLPVPAGDGARAAGGAARCERGPAGTGGGQPRRQPECAGAAGAHAAAGGAVHPRGTLCSRQGTGPVLSGRPRVGPRAAAGAAGGPGGGRAAAIHAAAAATWGRQGPAAGAISAGRPAGAAAWC